MPLKEITIKKIYYSIGEVAAMFDVKNSLIRFWEKEFSIIKPKKNKKETVISLKKILIILRSSFIWLKKEGIH